MVRGWLCSFQIWPYNLHDCPLISSNKLNLECWNQIETKNKQMNNPEKKKNIGLLTDIPKFNVLCSISWIVEILKN